MLLKKIAISGLGGVGGYYGALLSKEAEREGLGREIYFIARTKHAEAIRERGLKVFTPTGSFISEPTAVIDSTKELQGETSKDLPKMDLIIVATKSYDLEANIRELSPLIAEHTIILPLLNGANISERIQAVLKDNEVWHGCTYISGRKKGAGEIELLAERELFLFGSSKTIATKEESELQKLLLASGITAENHRDIKTTIYKKFAMISSTATATSYFNLTVGEVLEQHSEAMTQLVDEVCTLLKAKGMQNIEEVKAFVHKRQRIMPQHTTSSMHADFLAGHQTELENLTGYVVQEAERLGLELALYKEMYQALQEKPYPQPQEA